MNLSIDVSNVVRLENLSHTCDPDSDAIMSILSDVCAALEESGGAQFVVSGFGESRWPVDIATDLATFLEQLPTAIAAVETRQPFAIDFYEQGVERLIRFEPSSDIYIAFEPSSDIYIAHAESSAASLDTWSPTIAVETIPRSTLRDMLNTALTTFVDFLATQAPALAAHDSVIAWARGGSDGGTIA